MNTSKKAIWGVVVIVVVLVGLYVLTKTPKGDKQLIRIGAIISQTGDAASYGEFSLRAARLAADEINAGGGMNGRKVYLVVEDDHTTARDAVSAFNKLIHFDNVDAVFGGLFDFTAQPLIPLALDNQTAFISPINARIPGYFDTNKQTFVMLSDFEKIIRTLKPTIQEKHAKRLAVIRFGSEFGNEISRTLADVMQELGGERVIDEVYGQIGGNDFRTTILKVKQANPDILFIDMLDSDAVVFLQRAREVKFAPTILSHNAILDALKNPTVDKKLLEGVVVLNWDLSSEEFNALYKKTYGVEAEKSAGRSYDAVYILAEAVAKTASRAAVAEYIENHEFKTLNETLRFTKDHAAESVPVEIGTIRGGKLEK